MIYLYNISFEHNLDIIYEYTMIIISLTGAV